MRIKILTAVTPLFLLSAQQDAKEDPSVLFRSCAYTFNVPSRNAPPKPAADFTLKPLGATAILRPKADWGDLRQGDHFAIVVSSVRGGYFYIFQDEAGSARALAFPTSRNLTQLKPGAAFTTPSFGVEPTPAVLLLAVSPDPIWDAENMTAEQVREYFRLRRYCDGFLLVEKKLNL